MSIDIDSSLKRIAWAYGCAKRDSEEEADLGKLLLAKFRVNSSSPVLNSGRTTRVRVERLTRTQVIDSILKYPGMFAADTPKLKLAPHVKEALT